MSKMSFEFNIEKVEEKDKALLKRNTSGMTDKLVTALVSMKNPIGFKVVGETYKLETDEAIKETTQKIRNLANSVNLELKLQSKNFKLVARLQPVEEQENTYRAVFLVENRTKTE